jgi:hypothetical protein
VPTNIVALVMQAQPGAELACRAWNYRFGAPGNPQARGVISYYATQSLAQATTVASWLQRMEALATADLQREHLPWFYRPSLQILGRAATRLPGDPVNAEAEQHR